MKKKIAVQKELAFVAEKMNKLAPLVGILITIPASPKILRALAKCSSRFQEGILSPFHLIISLNKYKNKQEQISSSTTATQTSYITTARSLTMLTNSENVKPNNLRPTSAPVAVRTPAKKYNSSCATPTSHSRPTTAARKPVGTPVSSREAAIFAKAQHTAEKQKKTSLLKEKWAKEKLEKKELATKKREEEIKARQHLSTLTSKFRQKSIEKNNQFNKVKKEQEREVLKSSITENIVARKKIEATEKARRRQSVMVNKEILSRAKRNQSKLMRKKQEEEDNLHISRRIDFLSVREGKLEEEEKRRKSLEKMNAYARMQNELEKELNAVKSEQSQDILSVRKEMHEDDNKAKETLKMNRRQSLMGRLDTWRSQRKVEDDLQRKQQEALQLDIIQKHEDWLDIQEVKKEYKDRARQSVLWTLDKWRETKDLDCEETLHKQIADQTARELFLQEYEDVLQYKQNQEDFRRQSLAYRYVHMHMEWDFCIVYNFIA